MTVTSEQIFSIKNGTYLYIMGIIVAIFVLGQSVFFLVNAWKRGKEIGLSESKMKAAAVSSATFSIVPSVPIVLSLLTLAATLGVPYAWTRLSVIGSMVYEVSAAEAVAASGDLGGDLSVFASAMWVMALGILIGPIINVFFLKKYQSRIKALRLKSTVWTEILIAALFMGMISALGSKEIAKGGIALYTLFSGAVIMGLFGLIISLTKAKWLENFALPISMLGAIALSVLYVSVGLA
jgi:hypothetical protein